MLPVSSWTHWFVQNLGLVPVYPFLAFLAIVLGRALKLYKTKEISMALVVGATLMGLVHAVALLCAWTGHSVTLPIEMNAPWLSAGVFQLSMGLLIDSMSAMMLFVVTFISMFIQIYTHGYMNHDEGYNKFFAYLALFNFSMLGLVLSSNLFQMYVFWELVGVSSYLLIGFWFFKPAAAAACMKAFLMNRVGDLGFLVGVLTLLFFSFTWWPQYIASHSMPGAQAAWLSFSALPALSPVLLKAMGPTLFAVMAFLIFMGPMAKSAQVPLHTWLPDAMEGPTPISALIHAATMVAAGVYLVGRVFPLFQLSPEAMGVVAIIGTVTAVFGATVAVTQYDIKKALAYSTVSQLGFMVAAMGVGAFSAALFHLLTHAFFKAMMFLGSGSVIHACEDEQDMRQMGGLLRKLPITGWTYLIGVMAISGVLWTSGFWSKDEILVGAQAASKPIFYTLAVTAGLTSFYMFRTFFMTFTGSYRGKAHVHHETPVMTMPLLVLAVPSLAIGYVLSGMLGANTAFSHWISPPAVMGAAHGAAHHVSHHAGHHVGLFTPIGVLSIVIGLSGMVLAWLFYGPKPVLSTAPVKLVLAPVHQFFTRLWYFNELYQWLVGSLYLGVARFSAWLDSTVVDGVVNATGRASLVTGDLLRSLQTGSIQVAVGVLFFGVVTLSLLFSLLS